MKYLSHEDLGQLATWLGIGLMVCFASPVTADTAEELRAAGHLQLETELTPVGEIVPGQKVSLTLAIATDRWFTGGARIGIPEVAGLVILQTQQFASNASETRNGQSWVVQRWTLDIYPQRAGQFVIPSLPVRVKVNTADAGDVEGELSTQPESLSVSVPPALAQAEYWVAAPAFEVSQSFDRSLEDLQVGDAFEREVVFEASDVLAMMLPTLAAETIPGLAAYPSPPSLDNSSNRGQTSASRTRRISYVVEAEGTYLLPVREYFWWDTQSAQLQLLSLPATEISVGAGAASPSRRAIAALAISPKQLLLALAGLVLLSFALWLAWQRLPAIPAARLTAALSRLRRDGLSGSTSEVAAVSRQPSAVCQLA